MKAITTKYFGPGERRGSRIKASCEGASVTIPYPYELSGEDCHRAGAIALIQKMKWAPVVIVGGGLPDGNGYAFVMLGGATPYAVQ